MNDFVLHELSNADLSLVRIKNDNLYCTKHDAMIKISNDGMWRCLSEAFIGKKDQIFENLCRAGGNYG